MSARLLYRLGRRSRIHGCRDRLQRGVDAPRRRARFRVRIGHGGALRPRCRRQPRSAAARPVGLRSGSTKYGQATSESSSPSRRRREDRRAHAPARRGGRRRHPASISACTASWRRCASADDIGLATPWRPGLLAAVEHEDAAVPDGPPGLVTVGPRDHRQTSSPPLTSSHAWRAPLPRRKRSQRSRLSPIGSNA